MVNELQSISTFFNFISWLNTNVPPMDRKKSLFAESKFYRYAVEVQYARAQTSKFSKY